jgi:hypothetical protein
LALVELHPVAGFAGARKLNAAELTENFGRAPGVAVASSPLAALLTGVGVPRPGPGGGLRGETGWQASRLTAASEIIKAQRSVAERLE